MILLLREPKFHLQRIKRQILPRQLILPGPKIPVLLAFSFIEDEEGASNAALDLGVGYACPGRTKMLDL